MGTQTKTVIAISQKTYTTSSNIWEVGGTPTTGDGVARTAKEWFDYLNTDTGAVVTGLSSSDYAEFNRFYVPDTIEFIDETIAEMLGYEVGTVYPADTFNESERWGSAKLVLQNSVNPAPLSNSLIQSFEEKALDFEKNVTILRGFAPISDYEQEDDRVSYLCEVRMFPNARKEDVKLFLHTNGNGEAEELFIYGLEFKIDNTTAFNLNLKNYSGISENYSNKNLKQFDIGFIEAI